MRVVIVAAGDLAPDDARWLDHADVVIAADGGAGSLDRIGRRPDLLVGDLDSADPSLVERLEAAGTRVERHAPDKDASDTELALRAALDEGPMEVVILGALGGTRLDHELANLLLLALPGRPPPNVRIAHGPTTVRILTGSGRLELVGVVGDLVTLLPIGGDAVGVTTAGLRWSLERASLRTGRSLGLSNEIVASPAAVSLERGVLLVVETDKHEGSSS